jgi:hypothetical protein
MWKNGLVERDMTPDVLRENVCEGTGSDCFEDHLQLQNKGTSNNDETTHSISLIVLLHDPSSSFHHSPHSLAAKHPTMTMMTN